MTTIKKEKGTIPDYVQGWGGDAPQYGCNVVSRGLSLVGSLAMPVSITGMRKGKLKNVCHSSVQRHRHETVLSLSLCELRAPDKPNSPLDSKKKRFEFHAVQPTVKRSSNSRVSLLSTENSIN